MGLGMSYVVDTHLQNARRARYIESFRQGMASYCPKKLTIWARVACFGETESQERNLERVSLRHLSAPAVRPLGLFGLR